MFSVCFFFWSILVRASMVVASVLTAMRSLRTVTPVHFICGAKKAHLPLLLTAVLLLSLVGIQQ